MRRLIYTAMLLLMVACGANSISIKNYNIELYKPSWAEGFLILGAKDTKSTIIEVKNPWQGAQGITTRLFIARDGERAPSDFRGQVIQGEAKRIVCMSSTQLAMLDLVASADRVVGVSGINFISNEYINQQRDSIGDVGYEGNINYELLLSLEPDLVLVYGLNGASTMEGKLKELGVAFAYIGEYLEESPLGKAEWSVAVAEIVGKRPEGIENFSAIPQKYNELKALTCNIDSTEKPKIMINAPYGDAWVMAPNGSYVAQLIADAGGNYIYANNSRSTRSESIDIEEAYLMASQADKWVNLGSIATLKELESQLPKFADIECVISREVYNSNKKVNPSGGDDYWESGVVHPDVVLQDLITIFHPALLPTDSLVYYKQLL